MKYKFQCDSCGETGETDNDNINEAVMGIMHLDGCNDKLGAPWHPKCIYDWKYPNRPPEK